MKLNAEQVLKNLIEVVTVSLNELAGSKSEFVFGEKYAYVECLQVMQRWEKSEKYGLDVNLEAKYNIE